MASSGKNEEAHAALSNYTRTHIADLSPISTFEGKRIEADIVLVWPYSSATEELSLLLAESDVSLRKAKGQVKVTFHGAVAREVARSRPGIGDNIWLGLGGVELVEEQDNVSTPGKKAGFTLHAYSAVQLQVSSQEGQPQLIDFVTPTTPPTSPLQTTYVAENGAVVELETLVSDRILDISKTRVVSGSASVLRTSQRLSSNSFPGSMVDPFTQENDQIAERGRKRLKFARHSGAWRFTDADVGETDVDNPQEDIHVVADSTPTVQISESEGGAGEAKGASPLESALPEPIFAEAVELGDPQMLELQSIEHGTAAYIDGRINDKYESLNHTPSPQSQTNAHDESSSLSTDQIIPVERTSVSPANSTGVDTPRLEAVTSPSLAAISPFVPRRQHLSQLLGCDSALGDSAHTVEQPDAFYQVPDLREPNVISAEPLETDLQPPSYERNALLQENDVQLAVPRSNLVAQDIDLDALQQQIDMENGTGLFTVETVQEVIRGEDIYGAPASTQFKPEIEEPGAQRIPSKATPTPTPSADDPTVPVDHDDDVEEVAAAAAAAEEEEEEEEEDSDGTQDSGGEPDLYVGLSEESMVKHTALEIDAEDSLTEEDKDGDEDVDVVAISPPYLDSSPTSATVDAETGREEPAEDESTSQPAYIALESPKAAEHPENGIAAKNANKLNSDEVEHSPTQSPQFLDGVSNEVLPFDMPLLHVDTVEIQLPTIEEQPVETFDSTVDLKDSAVENSLIDEVLPHAETGSCETITDELPSSHTTQIDAKFQGGQVGVQAGLTGEMPSRPVDSQRIPPEAEDEALNTPADFLPPLPQVDGTPAGASRRMLDKLRMSDNVYSDYFTPRKSAIETKDSVPSEIAIVSEDQRRFASSNPATHVSRDMDDGLEMHPERHTIRTRQPTTADDVPWASSRGTATNMGYYVYLDYLGDYYGQVVDVLAVCTANATAPERAKSGPKDFNTTIHLADPSAPADINTPVTAQIFRPHKNAMPAVRRGDAILLRNFKVQTQLHNPFLLSTDESAWAVFSAEGQDATAAGPPVEFDDMERAFVSRLFEWWANHGKDNYPNHPTQTQSQPANDTPVVKKPAPQPLDLRRSPRITRQGRTEGHPEQDRSPSFNPQSPTLSHGTAKSSVPPAATSIASPTSPASFIMPKTRSAFATASAANGKGGSQTDPPPPASTPLNTSRTRNRHVHIGSTTTAGDQADEHEAGRRTIAEDDGAIISETETSASSKVRHRHERRSTSLIHELRDGTQWVDIDEFEVVSVSERETDDEEEEDADDTDPNPSTAHQPDLIAPKVSPQSAIADTSKRGRGRGRQAKEALQQYADTPSKRRPGRPRKAATDEPSPSRTDAVESGETRPQSSHSQAGAAMASPGRITRSQAAKDHNVHELRDGATYED